jgi:hypothetical protein
MYRFSRYPHNGTDKAIMIIQGRASYLNRGPPAASGMRICIRASMLYSIALTNWRHQQWRVPHGDIPFLGTAESIRHELFL